MDKFAITNVHDGTPKKPPKTSPIFFHFFWCMKNKYMLKTMIIIFNFKNIIIMKNKYYTLIIIYFKYDLLTSLSFFLHVYV